MQNDEAPTIGGFVTAILFIFTLSLNLFRLNRIFKICWVQAVTPAIGGF